MSKQAATQWFDNCYVTKFGWSFYGVSDIWSTSTLTRSQTYSHFAEKGHLFIFVYIPYVSYSLQRCAVATRHVRPEVSVPLMQQEPPSAALNSMRCATSSPVVPLTHAV